ncbi:hypothetical protein [Pseudomonas sp.]|uniref:hypothetical protein n=1 Tax=Pseudomonas sp. TaxID=306 RepID=UPI0028A85255|nr:hypothetical protein [Pseudomonas sp.]
MVGDTGGDHPGFCQPVLAQLHGETVVLVTGWCLGFVLVRSGQGDGGAIDEYFHHRALFGLRGVHGPAL